MSWLALLPAALLAALLLFGLGVPVLLAAGIRGFPVAALAPATSLTIIAVTAILTTPLGLPWTWIAPAVVALLLTVALAAGACSYTPSTLEVAEPDRVPLAQSQDRGQGVELHHQPPTRSQPCRTRKSRCTPRISASRSQSCSAARARA